MKITDPVCKKEGSILVQIYFDNQSGTRLDERVLAAMLLYLKDDYGNAQSMHSLGQQAKDALDQARAQVADFIGAAKPDEIYFTATGSEANNLAIKGIAQSYQGKGKHIIMSSIEHFSVLNCGKRLEQAGFEVTYLPVGKGGLVSADDLKKALRPDTILVSIQLANSEIGAVQPIPELAKIAKEYSAGNIKDKSLIFHTDAVFAAGFLEVNVGKLGVDALTLSGNQFYGPKGAAALYLKKGTRITPQIDGGVQENGRRAGTENIPAIIGFGAACELAKKEMPDHCPRLLKLRDKLIAELPKKVEYLYLTGDLNNRTCHNISFCVEFIEGEGLMLFLDQKGINASSGSACANKALKMSHVLTAIGMDVAVGQGSISLTLSKYNTEADVDFFLEQLPPIVAKLRSMSPIYAYFQKTGQRQAAGPGTDYEHTHESEHQGEGEQ